jgi:hypothetical protein
MGQMNEELYEYAARHEGYSGNHEKSLDDYAEI